MGLRVNVRLHKKSRSKKAILRWLVGDESMYITIKDGKISSGVVGQKTNSDRNDFYVYEWYIKKTGEIFYVGKGCADRYKAPHEHSQWAERIREKYDTGIRFLVSGVSEDEALQKETEEITRILNDTNDILTNKIIPIGVRRSGLWYKPASDSVKLEFEQAPIIYVTEIEKHYFGREGRQFDLISEELLHRPFFAKDWVSDSINSIVYHKQYESYYKEVVDALESKTDCKLLSSRYAKSVTAWIYAGEISLEFYENLQEYTEHNHGRRIPCIHLIDVWKYLKTTNQLSKQNDNIQKRVIISLNGNNTRCPITEIKNFDNWQRGFEEGSTLCFEGDNEQKNGNYEKAIELFDKARYCGYIVPYLYECYAKTYRKMNDIQNEIEILSEAIEQMYRQGQTNKAIRFEDQKRKAEKRLKE